MLTIDRLSLRLPREYRRRAVEIARLTARSLAALRPSASGSLGDLALPPVEIGRGLRDGEVAETIARAVAGALDATGRGGGRG